MTLWKVKTDAERDHWDFVPFISVGPLRFGMTGSEVEAALGAATVVTGGRVLPDGSLHDGSSAFEYRDLTAYFRDGRLYCVAIDALVGPQVAVDGVALVGRVPSEVERWALNRVERNELELRYTHDADLHLPDYGLIVRVQRAGDIVLSRPVLLDSRAEVSWDYVPAGEWRVF